MKKAILILLLLATLAVAWLYWQPATPDSSNVARVSNIVKQAPAVVSDKTWDENVQEGEANTADTSVNDDTTAWSDTNEDKQVEWEVFVPEQPLAEVADDVAQNAAVEWQVYKLASNSRVEWRGTKVGGAHNWYVPVIDWKIVVADGTIAAGTFTVAIDQIKTTDIDSEDLDNKLKGWFNAGEFPTATFDIVEVTWTSVQWNMTINGITKTISFPAVVIVEEDIVIASAEFALDRNEWNVAWGTPMVSEFMELSLSLTWSK